MEPAIKHSDKNFLETRWGGALFASFTGALSWPELRTLTLDAKRNNSELFILCASEHLFSLNYSTAYLKAGIAEAEMEGADILLGGVNWFESAIQIGENLFWVDKFKGMQFVVFFKQFYDALLSVDNSAGEMTDYILSSIAFNKMLLFPFISPVSEKIPKPVSLKGEVTFYPDPAEQLELLVQVRKYYSSIKTG